MNYSDLRIRSWRLYFERLVCPAILCEERNSTYRRDIQDNRGNNRFSTLERASEIEAPFIRKRARSSQSRSNLIKILIKANIFIEDTRQ